MAGREGASSSGSTNFHGGELQADEIPRVATHGKRGITNLDEFKIKDPGVSLFTMALPTVGEASESDHMVCVYVDSFPKDDRWMPPLHGDDVESLSDNLVKELDEQRHNYAGFKGILEAHGCPCSSLEEHFLPCLKAEEELLHPAIRRDICGGSQEQQAPEKSGSASSMNSTLSLSFSYSMELGHLVRPSTEEMERCLEVLPEHLADIAWKSIFKSSNDEAVDAVNCSDWRKACECYEACLLLLQLEDVKESISTNIQTWLLLWVSIPLAYLYQVRLGNHYPRCVTLYDQMLQQLNRTDDTNLMELYYSIIWHRRMVLFQWRYTFDKPEDQLLAQYICSRAFSEVSVVEDFEHFPGFMKLQRMINYWGRRTQRGFEGDMRVAFCSNLEHLYRKSKQWSEAVKWTREKWRWIRTYSDVSHEVNLEWRFGDVKSLFDARSTEEARRMIGVLEEYKDAVLPQVILYKMRYWKAKFLANPIAANEQLQMLKADLEKKIKTGLSDQKLNSDLLVLVKLEISMLTREHLRSATILERAPVGAEEGQEWDDDFDTTAIGFLNDIRSNIALKSSEEKYQFHFIRGRQLLQSLGKHFKAKDIEDYRNRVLEAVDHFQKSLALMPQIEDTVRFGDEVIEHEEVVDKLRLVGRHRVRCHFSLGVCYTGARILKPPEVKYNENLRKELNPSAEIASTSLNKADTHLQIALALADSNGYDDLLPNINAGLGKVHFYQAQQYYKWLTDFKDSMPLFRINFAVNNGNSKSEVQLFAMKNCGNMYHKHWHVLELLKNQIFCDYFQFPRIPDSSPSSSSSPPPNGPNPFPPFERVRVTQTRGYWRGTGVVEQPLTDELLERALRLCLSGLVKQTLGEIKQSTDYFERVLKLLNKLTPFGTLEEPQNQLIPHVSILETTKTLFTCLQRLIVWAVAIKDMIGDDVELQAVLSFKADPATAEFLQSERGDLTRKALLWAERGRSRSLAQQLLANKQVDKPIHDMVIFNMTEDQDEWNILKNVRLSCGKNTVFVEYTFDATHEYLSDVIEFNRIITWIVYVVTKDDKVHMRSYQAQSLSELSTSLKDINKKLSTGAEDAHKVKKALEDLYDAFIKPIFDLLDGMDPADKLVFAADEVLTNVPFSILLNAETKKYLFEEHTISFTPSFQVLQHCHRRLKLLQDSKLTVEPSVALGDPAYFHEKGRLKQSYFEVWKISSLFNTGSVKVLTGTEATVDNLLRLSGLPANTVQGFIHVAAHNQVDKDHKSGSLQLAHPSVKHQDPPSVELEDSTSEITNLGNNFAKLDVDVPDSVQRGGKDPAKAAEVEERKARQKARQKAKEAKESEAEATQKAKEAAEAEAGKKSYLPSERIMQRGSEWRSHMVVLSACNSAKGYVLASEGVVGLPRAFLVAGVPCIVASQWELEDKSSSDLMVEFYREMSRGMSDASSALREAMLRMMKQSRAGSSKEQVECIPLYKWGGYLVWGLPTVNLPPSIMKKIDEERSE